MQTNNRQWSFWNGWREVPQSRHELLKADIMDALGTIAHSTFIFRRVGKQRLTVDKKEAIETVFKKYGVAASKVWGDDKYNEKTTKQNQ